MIPRTELRASVALTAQASRIEGKRVATRPPACTGGVWNPCSSRTSTSPTPYAPTITVRYSIPSASIGTPNVKRSAP